MCEKNFINCVFVYVLKYVDRFNFIVNIIEMVNIIKSCVFFFGIGYYDKFVI